MTESKDIITLTADGKYTIFNTPKVDEKMKPILTRLESLVLYLQGQSTWHAMRYDFFITWNVVNGKPYVSKILFGKYLECRKISVNFVFKFVNRTVELTVNKPVLRSDKDRFECGVITVAHFENLEFYSFDEVKDETKQLSMCDEYLKRIEYAVYDGKHEPKPISLKLVKSELAIHEYKYMPEQIKKMCNVLYDTFAETKKEFQEVSWSLRNDEYLPSRLALDCIETNKFSLDLYCTHIIIPDSDVEASFGVDGTNVHPIYKNCTSSYNHITQIRKSNRLHEYSHEPSEKELNDIYDIVITWLEKTMK